MVVLEVAIDGLGDTDYLDASIMSLVILGKHCGIGIAVVTTDDDHSGNIEFTEDIQSSLELLRALEFGTARTDDVKATGVAVLLDNVLGEFTITVLNQTVGATQEAIQTAILVQSLDTIIEATNHIVSTGSLTATEDHAHVEGLLGRHRRVVTLKSEFGHSIGAGEEGLDSLLVCNRLSGLALDRTHRAPKCCGQFGSVSQPHILQITLIVCHVVDEILNGLYKRSQSFSRLQKYCLFVTHTS